MRREAGAVGLIGMMLVLVIVLAAAYFMVQSGGLRGGKGEERGPTPIDQALMTSALTELRMVRQGLEMYRSQSGSGAYPASGEINSIEELRALLPAYLALPDSVSFTFNSYMSTAPDQFLLKVHARDTGRTVLEVSSDFGPRRFKP